MRERTVQENTVIERGTELFGRRTELQRQNIVGAGNGVELKQCEDEIETFTQEDLIPAYNSFMSDNNAKAIVPAENEQLTADLSGTTFVVFKEISGSIDRLNRGELQPLDIAL